MKVILKNWNRTGNIGLVVVGSPSVIAVDPVK